MVWVHYYKWSCEDFCFPSDFSLAERVLFAPKLRTPNIQRLFARPGGWRIIKASRYKCACKVKTSSRRRMASWFSSSSTSTSLVNANVSNVCARREKGGHTMLKTRVHARGALEPKVVCDWLGYFGRAERFKRATLSRSLACFP